MSGSFIDLNVQSLRKSVGSVRTQPNGPLSTNDTDNPVHTPRLTTMVVTGYEGLKVVTEPFLHDSNLTKYGIQRSIEGF